MPEAMLARQKSGNECSKGDFRHGKFAGQVVISTVCKHGHIELDCNDTAATDP